eukprot:GHVU01014958.1.p1 GENE.GHVU01014958.1~~GHVU01014958.1.p1  ORF type:complete len:528 (-),score=18.00 GHVU01014958.1:76-1659(-)
MFTTGDYYVSPQSLTESMRHSALTDKSRQTSLQTEDWYGSSPLMSSQDMGSASSGSTMSINSLPSLSSGSGFSSSDSLSDTDSQYSDFEPLTNDAHASTSSIIDSSDNSMNASDCSFPRTRPLHQETITQHNWKCSSPSPPDDCTTPRGTTPRCASTPFPASLRSGGTRSSLISRPMRRPRQPSSYFPRIDSPLRAGGEDGYESGAEGPFRRSPFSSPRPVRRSRWLGVKPASPASLQARSMSPIAMDDAGRSLSFETSSCGVTTEGLPVNHSEYPFSHVARTNSSLSSDDDVDVGVRRPRPSSIDISSVSRYDMAAEIRRGANSTCRLTSIEEADITESVQVRGSPPLIRIAPLTGIHPDTPIPEPESPIVEDFPFLSLPAVPYSVEAYLCVAASIQREAKAHIKKCPLVVLGLGVPSKARVRPRSPSSSFASGIRRSAHTYYIPPRPRRAEATGRQMPTRGTTLTRILECVPDDILLTPSPVELLPSLMFPFSAPALPLPPSDAAPAHPQFGPQTPSVSSSSLRG